MHLKSIEFIGFKSFADRTKLFFEKGMTSIVGPNGCGKSNVSDALRWVLGEQSAKALRGAKMEDVIFNGTDGRQPVNMAEVTLTLTDCEDKLGVDFHEVSITRRVFRSGEGQYFINKQPCRLKDIQRMFMDTGIGTNAYSVLEQGKIDMILSSRPDDRRAVFEEASGITKYKADKKDALRKLDQTDANLLRLEDIVREVKRRIGSLQRQAGKARRYKTLQDKLRGFDIYAHRHRLNRLEKEIRDEDKQVGTLNEQLDAVRADLAESESAAAMSRDNLQHTEQEMTEAMEASVRIKSDLQSTVHLIQVNRDRISEIEAYANRDSRDVKEAQNRLSEHREALEAINRERSEAESARDEAQRELNVSQEQLTELDRRLNETRHRMETLRDGALELEARISNLQNEVGELENRDRSSVVQKEKLAAEQGDIENGLLLKESLLAEMRERETGMLAELEQRETRLEELKTSRKRKSEEIEELRRALHGLEQRAAATMARLELLMSADADEEFPGGARLLLGDETVPGLDRSCILGTLADKISSEPEFRLALEACLRGWADAVVVRDTGSLVDVLRVLERENAGSARLLAASAPWIAADAEAGIGEPLLHQVQCDPEYGELAQRLLQNVFVVDSLDTLPARPESGATFVTRDGRLLRGDGSAENYRPGEDDGNSTGANPLARRHLREQTAQELKDLEREIGDLVERLKQQEQDGHSAEQALDQARNAADEQKRLLASHRGEFQVLERESKQVHSRLETVSFELKALLERTASGDDTRQSIHREIESGREQLAGMRAESGRLTEELKKLEEERTAAMNQTHERRLAAAAAEQHMDHLNRQKQPLSDRIREVEQMVEERAEGISSYQERIEKLKRELAEAEANMSPMNNQLVLHEEIVEQARSIRQEHINSVTESEKVLSAMRDSMQELQDRRNALDISLAEKRVHVQNALEHLASEYQLSREQIGDEPEPEWEEGVAPDLDQVELMAAEMKSKLDGMGPVNLVAIEEYQEVEERYQFLIQQQEDLTKSRQDLLEMIRKINETTTEMFTETFHKVNEHFQLLFTQLFGGGSAKLVLVNEEDVLESGIDIIARPPGKKLQTVSLLSGGERTMTAVGLLFALYSVKPSPFCFLDELDAALDDANIGRFVEMVKTFVQDSQFIVITHNRMTIGASDILYGVTMQEKGVSNIVSVKLSEYDDDYDERAKAGTGNIGKSNEEFEPAPVG